jgi:MarR family transcriptional regulator, transcriptional regulator for hemolysin
MPTLSPKREIAFVINDVARMLRTYADQHAATLGMTRAQWAVLVRLERAEGLKQAELAEQLDLQPISLTRLLDRLCDNGLIERRSDPKDRRAKRLFLTPAARPLLERLHVFGETLMTEVLDGVDKATLVAMLGQLDHIKENLRRAIQKKPTEDDFGVQSYG